MFSLVAFRVLNDLLIRRLDDNITMHVDERGGRLCSGLIWLRVRTVEGSCEYGD